MVQKSIVSIWTAKEQRISAPISGIHLKFNMNHVERLQRRVRARSNMKWTKPVYKEHAEEKKRRNKAIGKLLDRIGQILNS